MHRRSRSMIISALLFLLLPLLIQAFLLGAVDRPRLCSASASNRPQPSDSYQGGSPGLTMFDKTSMQFVSVTSSREHGEHRTFTSG